MSRKDVSVPSTTTIKDAKDKNQPANESKFHAEKDKNTKVKTDNLLTQSGVMDAYEYVQRQFIKHGFPNGNVFEYAAELVQKYDKKVKHKFELKKQEALRAVKEQEGSPKPEESKKGGRHDDASPDPKKKDDKKKPVDAKDQKAPQTKPVPPAAKK